MFDLALRPLKDVIIAPIITIVPSKVKPTHITYIAFIPGLLSAICSSLGQPYVALALWLLNRLGDGIDGALARARAQTTQWGGFADIIFIPIGVSTSIPNKQTSLALSALLGSFHINNVILFYLASALPMQSGAEKALTSLHMTPALIEGSESFFLFCLMIVAPGSFDLIAWTFTSLVSINIVQLVALARSAFKEMDVIKRNNSSS